MVIVAKARRIDVRDAGDRVAPTTGLRSLMVVDSSSAKDVQPSAGLSTAQVDQRREAVRVARVSSGSWRTDPISLLLTAVLVLAAIPTIVAWHSPLQVGAVILAVALALGALSRQKRRRRLPDIDALFPNDSIPVRRGSRLMELGAADVVPGDVMILAPGRRVPADAIILDSDSLVVEEPTSSGLRVRAEKIADPEGLAGAPLAERRTLVFAGSVVSEGYGTAVVLRV